MEKKIIELTKIEDDNYFCLLCGSKNATMKMKINRIKQGDNITSFQVCDECLCQMQKDIENRK